MVKRLIVVLDDPEESSPEHYLDILSEKLTDILADSNLEVVSVNEKKGDSEKSPKQ